MDKHKRIKSIKHYINDKEEMINQVFSCISEKQIKKMTPPILKDMSIDELKAECLVQLLTMSNSTIIDILDGRNSSKTAITNSENHRKNSETSKDKKYESREKKKGKWNKYNEDDSNCISTKTAKRKHKEKKHKSRKKKRRSENDNGDEQNDVKNDEESEGRNLLELLELEMRAKAIKSLIKKEEEREKFEEKNQGSKEKRVIHSEEVLDKNITKKERKIKEHVKNKIYDNGRIKLQLPSSTIPECSHSKIEEKRHLIKEEKKDDYDWSMDEEKLIYEDEDDENYEKNKQDLEANKESKSDENTANSWAERWLQSKEVKKVVATSKMLTVVRNKMKNNSKSKSKTPTTPITQSTLPRIELQGSVKEYDTLGQMNEAVMKDFNGK